VVMVSERRIDEGFGASIRPAVGYHAAADMTMPESKEGGPGVRGGGS
jgi:hypothetical protein